MNTIVKKGLRVSLGAYAITKKEIEKAVTEIARKNRLNKKEYKKLVGEALAQSKKIEKKIEIQVRQSLLAGIKTLQATTKKDLALLEKKVRGAVKK
ncbi:MAG: hypothetical protein NUV61_01780 [Candidatus Azambacteria bacterium]|nr:hypothetical protein [Candidatus Azambacteria bacterium]